MPRRRGRGARQPQLGGQAAGGNATTSPQQGQQAAQQTGLWSRRWVRVPVKFAGALLALFVVMSIFSWWTAPGPRTAIAWSEPAACLKGPVTFTVMVTKQRTETFKLPMGCQARWERKQTVAYQAFVNYAPEPRKYPRVLEPLPPGGNLTEFAFQVIDPEAEQVEVEVVVSPIPEPAGK